MTAEWPILYSFRRCPYAIRARLALALAAEKLELREIKLSDKPDAFLRVSSKGTVPVLLLPSGEVIEESWDIMRWALQSSRLKERGDWLPANTEWDEAIALLRENDDQFKFWLDRYKYADRYPEHPVTHYRAQAKQFLAALEERLQQHQGLISDRMTVIDLALFPFIRQFAHVDRDWFYQQSYPALHAWLTYWLESDLFKSVMKKYTPWRSGHEPVYFPDTE